MVTVFINWNIDPEIIKLFGVFSIRYYSLLFLTGLFLGYYIVKRIYIKENLPIEKLEKLAIFIFIGTIVGARFGHCLFYEPEYYFKQPLEIILPFRWDAGGRFEFTGFQGLASHGGAIGVLTAIVLYCKKYHTNFLWVLDKVAIATPVTGAFIRFGNFMNSEIIGEPTGSNYGIVFQRVDLLPRHPTQLYEAFLYLTIFLVLYRIYSNQKTKRQNGYVFGLFLVLLFGARFILEFLKINQVDFENGMILNMGQLLSIPFILSGIGLIIWKRTPVHNSKQHGNTGSSDLLVGN
ncbi:prolipoprotein diacylglyceryl transferase [Williamwhitmania taraxaci]|uniref:Phosphatidylglycerol--prolipoprotein diacylglyceryl transferase n=1 Tax=Williamwhitmania taraxaci TaxID=1640674 RepID=A0A1G6LNS9_9BACT|nr:prolipoprotein diacylglyceryl transferase [Williamwhitmania taraxaci]SDC44774.1 prolipoprotein diacylglyceryl transferase [Williamwhitmania taraxaci]